MAKPEQKRGAVEARRGARGLTPSDQLLAIFAINAILLAWVWISVSYLYGDRQPDLPDGIFWAAALIFLVSGSLSLIDAWWPRLRSIAEGGADGDDHDRDLKPVNINILFLKGAVFVLSAVDIIVLWQLAEATGGVLSPYAPFLPTPAVFASFVTKKWQTIAGLSIAVAFAIAISGLETPDPMPRLAVYQGSAVVMVLLAGILSALQAHAANTGPLTGNRGSQLPSTAADQPSSQSVRQPDDDDDLAPGVEA